MEIWNNGLSESDIADLRWYYPNAYKLWTENDDNLLKHYHEQGISIQRLADYFFRQPNAIRSRLLKFGYKV